MVDPKDPSTISVYKALNASVREEAAKNLGSEHRAAAEDKGLTKGKWLLNAWIDPNGHRGTTYAIQGPDGKVYTSLLDAQDAHDGKVKVTMICQRLQASGEICGEPKEMNPGSNCKCVKECKGKKNPKGRAPTIAQINRGEATTHWKAMTEDDKVDESTITKRNVKGPKSQTDIKLTTEEEASLPTFVAEYALDETILSDKQKKFMHECEVISKRMKDLEESIQQRQSGVLRALSNHRSNLRDTIKIMQYDTLDTAFESAKIRHPEKAKDLQLLQEGVLSKKPLPLDNEHTSDRTKECMTKVSESTDQQFVWKRKQNTSVTKDHLIFAISILGDSEHQDDHALLCTCQTLAEIENRQDPNFQYTERHRKNNKVGNTNINDLLSGAVDEVSTTLYLAETIKSPPQVMADIRQAYLSGGSPEEIVNKIKAANAKWKSQQV